MLNRPLWTNGFHFTHSARNVIQVPLNDILTHEMKFAVFRRDYIQDRFKEPQFPIQKVNLKVDSSGTCITIALPPTIYDEAKVEKLFPGNGVCFRVNISLLDVHENENKNQITFAFLAQYPHPDTIFLTRNFVSE